jgi:hypothetical protein
VVPFRMAISLMPMAPALAGINRLSYRQGERRAARIFGCRRLCARFARPAAGLSCGDTKLFLEPSGSLLNCHEWFPIAFPFTAWVPKRD